MDRNIFEAAANKAKKVSVEKPAPNNSEVITTVVKHDADNYGIEDPEIVSMFSRMREMRLSLESKLDEVRRKGDEKHIDVDAYLKKTVQFSPLEIEKSMRYQKEFEEKVNEIFPPESCLKKVKKSKEKLTQERKNKSLGSRKNWIPMR